MENWEKRYFVFIEEQCCDGGDEKFISEGYRFHDELKSFIASERELAKQEEIKISAIKNQSAELYYISAIKELCGAKVLDKVLEKVIELSKKDKKHREGLIASLHQNNNKQGGK